MISTNHLQRILFSWNKIEPCTILQYLTMKSLSSCCNPSHMRRRTLQSYSSFRVLSSLQPNAVCCGGAQHQAERSCFTEIIIFSSGLWYIHKFFQQENLAATQGQAIGQLQGPHQLWGSESPSQNQLFRSKSHHLSTSPSSLPYTHKQQSIGPQLADTLFFLFNNLQGGLFH